MSSNVHLDKLHELYEPILENGEHNPYVLGLNKTMPI